MTSEPEPFRVQQQDNESVLPEKPREWTPAFIVLVALIALIGLAATLFAISGKPIGNGLYSSPPGYIIRSNEQATLALNSVLFIVCLAGLWLARGALLRTGLLLRTIASLGVLFLLLPSVLAAFTVLPPWLVFLYLSLSFLYTPPYLELALGILGLLTQICFSYGLARWQPSDKVFIWVQLAVTLGLGTVLLKTSSLPQNTPLALVVEQVSGDFLGTAALVCFLLRPACWKAKPLIVLCFTAGPVALLFFNEILLQLFGVPGPVTQTLQITFAIDLSSLTLYILGVLLLVQRAHAQKKAPLR